MKIKTRLAINTLISLCVVIFILLSLVWSVREIVSAERKMKVVYNLRKVAFERILLRDEYLLYQEQRAAMQWHAKSAEFRRLLAQADKIIDQEIDKALLSDAHADFDETFYGFSRVIEDHSRRQRSTKNGTDFTEAESRQISQVLLRAYSLIDNINRMHESSEKQAVFARDRAAILVVIAILGGIGGIMVNSSIIRRTLAKRITVLAKGAEIIGAGDLDHRIAAEGSDELTALASASNEMAEKLSRSFTSVKNLRKEVAERKRAEELLREQSVWLRDAQRIGRIGSYVLDLRTGAWTSSDILDDIFGIDRDAERKIASWDALVHPEEREEMLKYLTQSVIAEQKPFNREYRIVRRKDGSVRWLWGIGELSFDRDGSPLKMIGVIQDITERKQSEDALRESERRLSEAQKMAQLGNWTWDVRTGSVEWSEQVYKIFHLDPNTFKPQIDSILALSPWPEDHESDKELIRKAIESHEKGDYEQRFLRPDGSTGYYYSTFQGKYDDKGDLISIIGTVLDITERKRAEEKIHELNEELEQRVMERTSQLEAANKELEAFSYSASHDLRGPLRHMAGFVELLNKRNQSLDEKSRHYLDVISKAAVQMGRLVDDLLSFSRMGRAEMMRSRVRLRDTVDDAIADLKSDAAGRDVAWELGDLPEVTGDAAMLKYAFVNLLSNALKFTRSRPQARIEIGCAPAAAPDEVVVFVKDNGVGFDMQYVDKLFGLFQRLHRSGEFEGTGVGLANVRRIVARHGGRTWAEGKVGEGATVSFSLPKGKDRT